MRFTKMFSLIMDVLNKDSDTKIDISITSRMAGQIELWTMMFENRPPWVDHKKIFGMNLAAAISGEMSRLVTLELKSEISGSARANYLNEQYKTVLADLRKNVEFACAKGGLIFKPYVTSNGISVQYIQADHFFPISFDSSGNIKQCVFVEQYRKRQKIYTRMEIHAISGNQIKIKNRAFVSTNEYNLGTEIGVNSVDIWSELSPEITYIGAKKLPFGYLKIPLANTEDQESPLGVSVYARARESIEIADKRYSQIDWEYDSKESAVHIADSMLKYDKTRDKFVYPGGKERLYRSLDFCSGAKDKPLLDVFSPVIRDQSFYNGLNNQLRLVEFHSNLAYGTLSDPQNVDKTAEEIKASKQRSYTAVAEIQGATQKALEDLVEAMDFYATLYNLSPVGVYDISFDWDDSIVVDKEKDRKLMMEEIAAGIRPAWEYRMKFFGEDEETAKMRLPVQNMIME